MEGLGSDSVETTSTVADFEEMSLVAPDVRISVAIDPKLSQNFLVEVFRVQKRVCRACVTRSSAAEVREAPKTTIPVCISHRVLK